MLTVNRLAKGFLDAHSSIVPSGAGIRCVRQHERQGADTWVDRYEAQWPGRARPLRSFACWSVRQTFWMKFPTTQPSPKLVLVTLYQL
jgi:hypothetical protein